MPKFQVVGFLPDLNCALLRVDGRLEMWIKCPIVTVNSLTVNGCELEYLRPVGRAWKVIDCPFNRQHYPDQIGRIYTDVHPAEVNVKEL